jgi:hypothetical protein
MPFSVQEFDNRRMPSLRALARGGYEVAQKPDPNSGMATFQRGQQQATQDTNPLGQGIDQQQRGMASRSAYDFDKSRETHAVGGPSTLNTVLPDARWEGVFQALQDRGVDKLASGAAKFGDAPGFFDTQNSSNSPAMQALKQHLVTQDLNNYRDPVTHQKIR